MRIPLFNDLSIRSAFYSNFGSLGIAMVMCTPHLLFVTEIPEEPQIFIEETCYNDISVCANPGSKEKTHGPYRTEYDSY